MEKEINLREIISIVWSGKWIIVLSVAIAVIISAVASFVMISPTYEANSMVRIAGSAQEGVNPIQMNTFVESVKSDAALHRLVVQLSLDPSTYTIESLRKQINVEVVKDINVMKIQVKGSDSLKSTNIANFLAYELGKRIDSTARSQNIVEDQKKLRRLSEEIESAKTQLNEAKKQLEAIPEKQSTVQTITDSPLLTNLAQEKLNIPSSEAIGLQMQSETINPAYTDVESQIAAISIELKRLITEEDNTKARIQSNTEKINTISSQIENDKLNGKTSDRLLEGEQAIFVSPAIESGTSVGPNKILYFALGAMIGLFISVIAVFFRHYLRSTAMDLKERTE